MTRRADDLLFLTDAEIASRLPMPTPAWEAAEAAKMDWCASIHSDGPRSRAYVECYVATRPKRKGGVAEIIADHHGDTTTPALALCAAFARAMAERSEG